MNAVLLLIATFAPLCAAAALWRRGRRARSLVAALELLVAAAAGAGLTVGMEDCWSVLVLSLASAALFVFISEQTLIPRGAFSMLLMGQAAAALVLLSDDLRLVGAGLMLCGLAAPMAVALVARSHTDVAFSESVFDTARRLLVPSAVGGCLAITGLLVGVFAEAAVEARLTRQTAALRFDWPAIRERLQVGSTSGGIGSEVWLQLAPWAGVPLVLGFGLLTGCVPVHRPIATAVRQLPPSLRVLFLATVMVVFWGAAVRVFFPLAAGTLSDLSPVLRSLAMLTFWLGSLLVLGRGDIPRLTAAAALQLSGLIGMTLTLPGGHGLDAARLLIAGALPAFVAVALLLSWLEASFDTLDFLEFSGLAWVLPRYSMLLTFCVLWLCGLPLMSVWPGVWSSWTATTIAHGNGPEGLAGVTLWTLLIPMLIGFWGWLRLLDQILLGASRTPAMSAVLMDRVEVIPASGSRPRDLLRREMWAVGLLIAWGLVMGLKPGVVSPVTQAVLSEPASLPELAPQPAAPQER